MTSARNATPGADPNDPTRTEDGLIRDEYTDPSLEHVRGVDALDVPSALRDESALDEGSPDDEGEMGFGAEAHDADELSAVTVGSAQRGSAFMRRDDEVHGEALFDSPDDLDEDDESDEVSDDAVSEDAADAASRANDER